MASEAKFLTTVRIDQITGESQTININYGTDRIFDAKGYILEVRYTGLDASYSIDVIGSVKGDVDADTDGIILQTSTVGTIPAGIRLINKDHNYPYLAFKINKLTATVGELQIYLAYY